MKSLHIGSAVIDIITLVASENIERATFTNDGKAFLMLETGRKVPAQSITSHVGGGACNTGVGLARRGWQAAVLARVGEDLSAEEVRRHLAANGVEDLTRPCARATGTAVMIASHDRNASIFVHRGANETLAEADLDAAAFAGRDLVYVSSLSNASAACFGPVLARGRTAGAMVAANPGIRQLTARTGEVMAALADLDLLSVNRVEAEALVPALAARGGADPAPPPDAPDLLAHGLSFGGFALGLAGFMAAVRALGPRFVSVTDGTGGAYLGTEDAIWWQPPVPAEVAGTAGAGDAFCSTLSAALAEGLDEGRALAEASVNASAVLGHVDTTTGLLTRDELTARMDAAPKARRFAPG